MLLFFSRIFIYAYLSQLRCSPSWVLIMGHVVPHGGGYCFKSHSFSIHRLQLHIRIDSELGMWQQWVHGRQLQTKKSQTVREQQCNVNYFEGCVSGPKTPYGNCLFDISPNGRLSGSIGHSSYQGTITDFHFPLISITQLMNKNN